MESYREKGKIPEYIPKEFLEEIKNVADWLHERLLGLDIFEDKTLVDSLVAVFITDCFDLYKSASINSEERESFFKTEAEKFLAEYQNEGTAQGWLREELSSYFDNEQDVNEHMRVFRNRFVSNNPFLGFEDERPVVAAQRYIKERIVN